MARAARIVRSEVPALVAAPAEPPPLSPLAKELRKKGGFQTPEQEAYLNLMRTASLLTQDAERLLKRHGLSGATYNALRILRGSGVAGRSCSRIADDMVAAVPDITRIVDRLERSGLATRSRQSEDRRVVTVHITKQGQDLLAKLDAPIIQSHRDQLGHMSKAEIAALNALLVKARRPPWKEVPAEE